MPDTFVQREALLTADLKTRQGVHVGGGVAQGHPQAAAGRVQRHKALAAPAVALEHAARRVGALRLRMEHRQHRLAVGAVQVQSRGQIQTRAGALVDGALASGIELQHFTIRRKGLSGEGLQAHLWRAGERAVVGWVGWRGHGRYHGTSRFTPSLIHAVWDARAAAGALPVPTGQRH